MLALLRGSAGLCLTGALAVLVLMVAGVTVGQAGEQGPEPSRGGMRSEAAGATPTCPTEACMALTVKGGTCVDAACTVSNGQKFTLAVEVEVAPAGGYLAAQTWVEYGSQLTYNPVALADEIVWPDCLGPAVRSETNTAVAHGCITALSIAAPLSTYTGNIVELSFTCSSGPSSTELRLVPLGESPANNHGAAFAFAPGAANQVVPSVRDLTVHCAAPVSTPTGTLPATPVSSATPMPTDGATATAPATPVETPIATPTATPAATVTLGGPPTASPTATPVPVETPVPTRTSPLVPTSTPVQLSLPVGDANCSGFVDAGDATFILQWWAGLVAVLHCPADANGDGTLSILDATVILQFAAGLISTLPP